MRLASWPVAVLAGALAAASPASAQTLPIPEIPRPEDQPKTDAASPKAAPGKSAAPPPVAAVAPASARPPWQYSIGAGLAWDSNIDFVRPDGASGTVFLPEAKGARLFSSTRGDLQASAGGRWAGYPSPEVLSRFYGDLGLSGDYKLATTSLLKLDAQYWLGYSDSSPALIEQGVPLPLVKTRTFDGTLSLRQQLRPRTALRVEARALQTSFIDSVLVDGSSLRGSLSVERKIATRDAIGVAYALERVVADPRLGAYVSHFGSLQWSRNVTTHSGVLTEAGASYTPDASRLGMGSAQSFYGGVTFARMMKHSTLVVYVRREVAPAFGLGVSRLETRGGVQLDVTLGDDWRLRLNSYFARPSVPDGAVRVYASSHDVSSDLTRRLRRQLGVVARGRYRHRGENASLPAVSAFQIGLFVVLGSL